MKGMSITLEAALDGLTHTTRTGTKGPSAVTTLEPVATPLGGTGSWLGRDNCGLFATPDAVALVMNPESGAARLIITKPESAAVIIFGDENTKRPHKPQ